MSSLYLRPPLKWAGGKFAQLEHILSHIPPGTGVFYEPFVGAGSVFLNVAAERTHIADMNCTLACFYQYLRDDPRFVTQCQALFTPENGTEGRYLALRSEFNNPGTSARHKAALLLYLNRHCFNGLYRVNSDGDFNTPYGHAASVQFPIAAMMNMWRRLSGATIRFADFEETIGLAGRGDVVYCDPPYATKAKKDFTSYSSGGFPWEFHEHLERCAWQASRRGATVLLSNADLPKVRELYHRADRIMTTSGRRSISSSGGTRGPVGEVLVLYSPRYN